MSKAIVFDLDGTLVDSAPDLMDAHNYVMQKFGYHQKPLTDIRHLAGRGAANMILSSLKEEEKKFDQNIHKKMTEEFINYYRENISKKSQIDFILKPLYCEVFIHFALFAQEIPGGRHLEFSRN